MKENMAHKQADDNIEEQLAPADLIDGLIDITEAVSEVAHPLEGIANSLVAEAGGIGNPVGTSRAPSVGGRGPGAATELTPPYLKSFAQKKDAEALDSFLLFKNILQTAFTYERAYITCAQAADKAGLLSATDEQPAMESAASTAPVSSTTPTTPTTPTASAISATPATPATPTAPPIPATPATPATPTAPPIPATPISSTTPATPTTSTPPPNLIVVPCLASIPSEVWLAALAEVPNIDIFLPPFSCDKCPVNEKGAAEKEYAKAISSAEAAASRGPGLVGAVKEITTQHQRALKREHFVESVSRLPQTLLQGKGPQSFEEQAAARAEALMADLHAFMRVVRRERSLATPPHEIPEDFNRTEAGSKKLIRPARLTKEQVLLLTTLHAHPSIAQNITLKYPVRNQSLCTFCGACQKTCPTQAIQFRRDNSFQVSQEACQASAGCDACERICPVHAIHYEAREATNLRNKE